MVKTARKFDRYQGGIYRKHELYIIKYHCQVLERSHQTSQRSFVYSFRFLFEFFYNLNFFGIQQVVRKNYEKCRGDYLINYHKLMKEKSKILSDQKPSTPSKPAYDMLKLFNVKFLLTF